MGHGRRGGGAIHDMCHFDKPSDVVRVFLSELSLAQRLSGRLWAAEQAARTALAMSRRHRDGVVTFAHARR